MVRWFDRFARLLVWISAAMATVMDADHLHQCGHALRLPEAPHGGLSRSIEITMGLLVFFALPMMVRQSGNIRVTILFDRFAEPVRRWATFATELTGHGHLRLHRLAHVGLWRTHPVVMARSRWNCAFRAARSRPSPCRFLARGWPPIAFGPFCALEGLKRAPPTASRD